LALFISLFLKKEEKWSNQNIAINHVFVGTVTADVRDE
jgi:hypothetical protein